MSREILYLSFLRMFISFYDTEHLLISLLNSRGRLQITLFCSWLPELLQSLHRLQWCQKLNCFHQSPLPEAGCDTSMVLKNERIRYKFLQRSHLQVMLSHIMHMSHARQLSRHITELRPPQQPWRSRNCHDIATSYSISQKLCYVALTGRAFTWKRDNEKWSQQRW